MGTHYNSAANDITLTAVNSFIDDDKELRNDIITGNYLKKRVRQSLIVKMQVLNVVSLSLRLYPLMLSLVLMK